MRTSSIPGEPLGMTTDCSFNWPKIQSIAGPFVRPGGVLLTERALQVCNLPPGSHVVDIGCGAGGTLERLEGIGSYRTVGCDCSEALLKEAAKRLASTQLVQGQAEGLPFKKDSFHALFCECVLSTLNGRTEALGEFSRVLRKGGYLILSDIFLQNSSGQDLPEEESISPEMREVPRKEEVCRSLEGFGLSLLLWEEHQRFLQEFVARLILAGHSLLGRRGCRHGLKGTGKDGPKISYFLMVARKTGTTVSSVEEEGGPNS